MLQSKIIGTLKEVAQPHVLSGSPQPILNKSPTPPFMIKTRIYFAGQWYVDVLQERENPTVGGTYWVVTRTKRFSSKEKAILFTRRYK
jgi:hypothetical protein